MLPTMREMVTTPDLERRRHLALLLGDYSIAAECGPVGDALAVRVAEVHSARAARLQRRVVEERSSEAMLALAALGRSWAEPLASGLLTKDPLDAVTCAAVELIEAWGDHNHHSALLELGRKARTERPPGPFLRSRALGIVLRSFRADSIPDSVRAAALEIVRDDAGASEAEAAMYIFPPRPGKRAPAPRARFAPSCPAYATRGRRMPRSRGHGRCGRRPPSCGDR